MSEVVQQHPIVKLYQITKRDSSDNPKEWKILFECRAETIGDAIRQANAKGIVCHNIDFIKSYPFDLWNTTLTVTDMKKMGWNDCSFDLDNLDLEGLYIMDLPCAHNDNHINNSNLRNSQISLLRPKHVDFSDCDLRGATICWENDMYSAKFTNCKMDENTRIPIHEPYQFSYDMDGTIYEHNGLYLENNFKKIYIDFETSEDNKAVIAEESTLVNSVDEANVVLVKDEENLSELAQKAKEKGIGILDISNLEFQGYEDFDVDDVE